MSAGQRVAAALVAGLLAGAGLRASGVGGGAALDWVDAVGGVWLDLLRMTVVPLVAALVVAAAAQVADAAAAGRLAGRAMALFLALLVAATVYAYASTQAALAIWPVDPSASEALRASAAGTAAPAAEPVAIAAWLRSLVPSNPIAAAANDQMLPLVVFSLALGVGATRIGEDLRAPLLTGIRALAEALIQVVRGVLWAAPLGVFALGVGVGARAGAGAAAVLVQYLVIVSAVTAGTVAAAFALAALFGRVPMGAFARGAAPVLVIALSTQSSLACLPSMLEQAAAMGVPERVSRLVLPLAVAVFRLSSPVANLAVVQFSAAVYGVHPSATQLVTAGVVAVAVSLASVGLPGQVSFFAAIAPIGLAMGVPLDLLPVFLAVEVIPDLFRTTGNVAADLAVTSICAR